MSTTSRKAIAPAPATDALAPIPPKVDWVELVRQKVEALEFGSVQIVVHDSKVVQIESTERHRFDLRKGT
ncbi:MAG TPA: YezD family protein [Chthoniobacteraceae bacterium]|jgi:hypothetical protein|nr:YezD family protein [Chthoniobacteraceae bacterium]